MQSVMHKVQTGRWLISVPEMLLGQACVEYARALHVSRSLWWYSLQSSDQVDHQGSASQRTITKGTEGKAVLQTGIDGAMCAISNPLLVGEKLVHGL